jgi:hypothetical protein
MLRSRFNRPWLAASIPRSNKTALAAAKNLAVAVYTRHQRAQQLRDNIHNNEGSDKVGQYRLTL